MDNIFYVLLDIMIAIPLGWGFYRGFSKGILAELVGTIHFAIAFAISFYIVGIVFGLAHGNIFKFDKAIFAKVVFACAVGGAFALLSTAGKYLKTEIEFDFPGSWDNIIGGIFGVVKFAIILSFFFWFIDGFGDLNKEFQGSSRLYPIVNNIAGQLLGAETPEQLDDRIIENNQP